MNFAGIGAKMMKARMKQKNVDQLDSMFAQARTAGVRMVACHMSMDIMGITLEELIEGVEIGALPFTMLTTACVPWIWQGIRLSILRYTPRQDFHLYLLRYVGAEVPS